MADWARFIFALEARGRRFDSVKLASDRRAVITAAGFTDALDVALLETEWANRLEQGTTGATPSTAGKQGALAAPIALPPVPRANAGESNSAVSVHINPAALSSHPEELQDHIMAEELLRALQGISGPYIAVSGGGTTSFVSASSAVSGRSAAAAAAAAGRAAGGGADATPVAMTLSRYVPESLRGLLHQMEPLVVAFVFVSDAQAMEHTPSSSVAMAFGEIVSELCCQYHERLTALHVWARQRPMPLMRVAAEARVVGYPILRVKQLLDDIRSAAGETPVGARLLSQLFAQYTRCSGNADDEQLVGLILRRAARPYMAMLSRWMNEGVIDDPHGEFFIAQNSQFMNEPDVVLRWEKRFTLRNDVPSFLGGKDKLGRLALHSGKFCFLLNECGWKPSVSATSVAPRVQPGGGGIGVVTTVARPPGFASSGGGATSGGAATTEPIHWGDLEDLQRVVSLAFETNSRDVVRMMRERFDLLGHLASLKHYFLQDQGDWLVGFLDSADELLEKNPGQVKLRAVNTLLQSAIAKTSSKSDRFHSRISCSFSDMTLPQYIQAALHDPTAAAAAEAAANGGPPHAPRATAVRVESKRCVELLQLEVNYDWPTTLVISPIFVGKMNCIFRLLLWCKVLERGLNGSWWFAAQEQQQQHLQAKRKPNTPASSSTPAPDAAAAALYQRFLSLRQQMLQFLRQFQFYAFNFVLEPLWHKMRERVTAAQSVNEMMSATYSFFEDTFVGLVLRSQHRFGCLAHLFEAIQSCSHRLRAPLPANADARARHGYTQLLIGFETRFREGLTRLANPNGPDYSALVPLLTWVDFSRFYERQGVYRVMHASAVAAATAAEAESDLFESDRRQQSQQSAAEEGEGDA